LSEIGSINRQPMKGIRFFKLPPSMQAKSAGIGAGWPDFGNLYSRKEESDSRPYFFGRHFTKNCGISSKKWDTSSKKCGIISKKCGIISKKCDILSKNQGISFKNWDTSSKKCDILSKNQGISFKNWAISSKKCDISSKKYSIILSFYARFCLSLRVYFFSTTPSNPFIYGTYKRLTTHYTSFRELTGNESLPWQWPITHLSNPKASLTLTI